MKKSEIIELVIASPDDRLEAIAAAARATKKPIPITGRVAAELLGVHRRTLHRLEARGLLHPVRLSRRLLRFDKSEIEDLMRKEVP